MRRNAVPSEPAAAPAVLKAYSLERGRPDVRATRPITGTVAPIATQAGPIDAASARSVKKVADPGPRAWTIVSRRMIPGSASPGRIAASPMASSSNP